MNQFAVLRHLRGIRRLVPRTVFQSLVLPRLDCCNAVLAGIPLNLARRLQSVMNAAARFVFASSKCDHITPLLRQLHWLKVPWRIDYKLAVLVYKCLHGLAPSYLADELIIQQSLSFEGVCVPQSLSFEGVCVPLRLTNCLVPVPDSQPTTTELFQSPLYRSGTVFRSISHLLRHFPSSAVARRHLRTLLPVITVVVPAK